MSDHETTQAATATTSSGLTGGSLAERIIFGHRRAILIGCLLLTVFLSIFLPRLEFNASFEDTIPVDHPFIKNYLERRGDLKGVGNGIRIAVRNERGTIFDPQYLELLRKLNDELFLLKGVDRPFMKSLWTPSTRWMAVTEDGLDGGPVIPEGFDDSPQSISLLRTNVERSGEVGQLVSPDYRSSIIYVPILERDVETGRTIDYAVFARAVDELRQKYERGGVTVHVTGFAMVVGALIAGLKQVLAFFSATVALTGAILYWYTRCVRSTILVLLCSLIAVLWLLGMLGATGVPLDPYSVLVPFLVFAIGMSHGAQKMNGIMQDIGRGQDKLSAARLTFRRLFVAGLTALLADVVGFAVLLTIKIAVIRQLAVTASLGVGVLVFTNLILLPILLSYLGVNSRAASRTLAIESDVQGRSSRVWNELSRFTDRKHARVVLAVALCLGLAGLFVARDLRIGDLDAGAPELRPHSRYNVDAAFMAENFSASSDIFVVMAQTKTNDCATYENLLKVDALEWELRQVPGVESTTSFATLTRRTISGLNEGNLKWYEVVRSQDMLNAGTTRAPRELINQDCNLLPVYAYLRDHKADTLSRVVQAAENFAALNSTESVKFLLAGGPAGIEAATNIVVKSANHMMLALVYLAVATLSMLALRSFPALVCAIVPLVLTSILCEALMVVLGIGVKVATLPVIALGVGIGVDYALYVLSVTLAEMRGGASLRDAYRKAVFFTGRVVVLTGVTLGVAVATWVASPIKFQADMGLLLAFMFVWNMVGALVLVPALAAYLLQERRVEADRPAAIVAYTG